MTVDRKNRVFIGGITDNISKDEIEKEFSKYGKLNSVWVAQNPPGFAFVTYDDERDAEEAVRQMNGSSIPGTSAKLRVEHSRGRSRGGRGGGRGFGGGRDFGGSRGGGGRSFGGGGGGRGGFSGGRGSRGGPYGGGFGGRGGDRRGGGPRDSGGPRGGGRFENRYSGSGPDYGKGGGSYPNYRSRSPLGQGGRRY